MIQQANNNGLHATPRQAASRLVTRLRSMVPGIFTLQHRHPFPLTVTRDSASRSSITPQDKNSGLHNTTAE